MHANQYKVIYVPIDANWAYKNIENKIQFANKRKWGKPLRGALQFTIKVRISDENGHD